MVGIEPERGARGDQDLMTHLADVAAGSGPMAFVAHESGGDGIDGEVSEGAQLVVETAQGVDSGLPIVPDGPLPTAEALGEEGEGAMEVAEEVGATTVSVDEDEVVVVAHEQQGADLDAVSKGVVSEEIEESVSNRGVRSEEEVLMQHTACDEDDFAGENGSGQGHEGTPGERGSPRSEHGPCRHA